MCAFPSATYKTTNERSTPELEDTVLQLNAVLAKRAVVPVEVRVQLTFAPSSDETPPAATLAVVSGPSSGKQVAVGEVTSVLGPAVTGGAVVAVAAGGPAKANANAASKVGVGAFPSMAVAAAVGTKDESKVGGAVLESKSAASEASPSPDGGDESKTGTTGTFDAVPLTGTLKYAGLEDEFVPEQHRGRIILIDTRVCTSVRHRSRPVLCCCASAHLLPVAAVVVVCWLQGGYKARIMAAAAVGAKAVVLLLHTKELHKPLGVTFGEDDEGKGKKKRAGAPAASAAGLPAGMAALLRQAAQSGDPRMLQELRAAIQQQPHVLANAPPQLRAQIMGALQGNAAAAGAGAPGATHGKGKPSALLESGELEGDEGVAFTPLSIPVVCVPAGAATQLLASAGVPAEDFPAHVHQRVLMKKLQAKGHSAELAARALQKNHNSLKAAAEWLDDNAEWLQHQTTIMAELELDMEGGGSGRQRLGSDGTLGSEEEEEEAGGKAADGDGAEPKYDLDVNGLDMNEVATRIKMWASEHGRMPTLAPKPLKVGGGIAGAVVAGGEGCVRPGRVSCLTQSTHTRAEKEPSGGRCVAHRQRDVAAGPSLGRVRHLVRSRCRPLRRATQWHRRWQHG